MNERSTYELTIAGKLKDLPLPDMMDAIWARVEKQLDIDMPTDDGGIEPTSAPTGGWPGVGVLGTVLTAIAFIFIQQQHHPANEVIPARITTPRSTIVLERDSFPTGKVDIKPGIQSKPGGGEPGPELVMYEPPEPAPDTAAYIFPPMQADTQKVTTETIQPRSMDSAMNKPKSRGVKGLSDDDYRIVPASKDSSIKGKS